jgi:hypothetical protein
MPIPTRIVLSDEQSFPVEQKSLNGPLGCLDRATGAIFIEENQPEVGKWTVLLHEMLHLVAELLVQNGTMKRQPPEAFITNAAPGLLIMLVRSGLWSWISEEDLQEFINSQPA